MILTILLILAAVGLVRFFIWVEGQKLSPMPPEPHRHDYDGPVKVRYEYDPPVTVSTCSVCGAFNYDRHREKEWNFNEQVGKR